MLGLCSIYTELCGLCSNYADYARIMLYKYKISNFVKSYQKIKNKCIFEFKNVIRFVISSVFL